MDNKEAVFLARNGRDGHDTPMEMYIPLDIMSFYQDGDGPEIQSRDLNRIECSMIVPSLEIRDHYKKLLETGEKIIPNYLDFSF